MHLYGRTCVYVELSSEKFQVDVIVADTPTADLITGRDFLHAQQCVIEWEMMVLYYTCGLVDNQSLLVGVRLYHLLVSM